MENRMNKTKIEVEEFLGKFMPKMDIWGIIFLDRKKNEQL